MHFYKKFKLTYIYNIILIGSISNNPRVVVSLLQFANASWIMIIKYSSAPIQWLSLSQSVSRSHISNTEHFQPNTHNLLTTTSP